MIEVASLLTSAKAAYDIAKGINSLQADVERNQSISKLLEILISVQLDASSMIANYQGIIDEKNKLAKKVMEFESWSKTEKQYDLKETTPGIFAYAYNKNEKNKEPMHYLCANCWQDRKKSILQHSHDGTYRCPKCEKYFTIFESKEPPFGGIGRRRW